MNPLLTKPPTNGVFCTAWILQGPFDLSTWLNWYMFYQGSEGVRNSFLDMWEYLAGNTFCIAQTSWHRTRTFTLLQGAACGTGELPLCPLRACAHALR